MTVALDTNVLALAKGLNGRRTKASTLRVLRRVPPEDTLIPVQGVTVANPFATRRNPLLEAMLSSSRLPTDWA